jgi:hypothetical protein
MRVSDDQEVRDGILPSDTIRAGFQPPRDRSCRGHKLTQGLRAAGHAVSAGGGHFNSIDCLKEPSHFGQVQQSEIFFVVQ